MKRKPGWGGDIKLIGHGGDPHANEIRNTFTKVLLFQKICIPSDKKSVLENKFFGPPSVLLRVDWPHVHAIHVSRFFFKFHHALTLIIEDDEIKKKHAE